MQRSARDPSWINLVLGAWVLLSPWVLGFTELNRPTWNAIVTGVGIAVIAAAAVGARSPSMAWANVLLGAWLFVSPWVLDYTAVETAARNAWIVGAVVVLLAAITAITGGRVDQRPASRLGPR